MSESKERFVSRLTKNSLALILAGGRGSRLHELTEWRAKPAVFFGGKFRIIDFPLSNCVNSGIRRIGIATQYKAHSLISHLVNGWSNFRNAQGEFLEILPASQRTTENWYQGTADAVYQNLDIIRSYNPEYVIILSGDHIYKMDYGKWIAFHYDAGADMSIACINVDLKLASQFGVVNVSDDGLTVTGFDEKPENPQPIPGQADKAFVSMGNYIFRTEFLFKALKDDAGNVKSSHDFGKDIIPSLIDHSKVLAYPFIDEKDLKQNYWRDVGTLDSFWSANIELLGVEPELDIYDQDWPIMTYHPQLPPAKFVFEEDLRTGMAVNSMVSGGCIISGAHVRRSLLFSNVYISSFSLVEDTVVMPDVKIKRHCEIKNAIIDRGCIIPEKTKIGFDEAHDRERFRVTEAGKVLVTPEMLDQKLHLHI